MEVCYYCQFRTPRPAPKLQLRSRCYGAATAAASSRLVSPLPTHFPCQKEGQVCHLLRWGIVAGGFRAKEMKSFEPKSREKQQHTWKIEKKNSVSAFFRLGNCWFTSPIHSFFRELPWDNQCNVLRRILFFFYKKKYFAKGLVGNRKAKLADA